MHCLFLCINITYLNNPLCTKLRKWWYIIEICLVLGENFLYSVTEIQPWLYYNTSQNTSVFGRCISKTKYSSFIKTIKVLLCAFPRSMQHIPLMWCLKRVLFLTYCTIILDIPRKLLYIPYVAWHFIHYRHLLDTIHRNSRHICNIQCLFLYRACKLFHVWLTGNLRLLNSHKYTFLQGTLQFLYGAFVHKTQIIEKTCTLVYGHWCFGLCWSWR